jgi:hydroxypyruvate isomerase
MIHTRLRPISLARCWAACRQCGRLVIEIRAMPRFAANISLMFAEHPFLDRFEAAAAAGFKAVECQSPYEHAIPAIKERLDRMGLALALINTRPGDPASDGFGLAAAAGRETEFQARVDQALDYADALGAAKIHAMAGDSLDTPAPSSTICARLARRPPRAVRRF